MKPNTAHEGVIIVGTVGLIDTTRGVAAIRVAEVFRREHEWMVGREFLVPAAMPYVTFGSKEGVLYCKLPGDTVDIERGETVVIAGTFDWRTARSKMQGGKEFYLPTANVSDERTYRSVKNSLPTAENGGVKKEADSPTKHGQTARDMRQSARHHQPALRPQTKPHGNGQVKAAVQQTPKQKTGNGAKGPVSGKTVTSGNPFEALDRGGIFAKSGE